MSFIKSLEKRDLFVTGALILFDFMKKKSYRISTMNRGFYEFSLNDLTDIFLDMYMSKN